MLSHAAQRGYVLFYARQDLDGEAYQRLIKVLEQDQRRVRNGKERPVAQRVVGDFQLGESCAGPNRIPEGQAPSWKKRAA